MPPKPEAIDRWCERHWRQEGRAPRLCSSSGREAWSVSEPVRTMQPIIKLALRLTAVKLAKSVFRWNVADDLAHQLAHYVSKKPGE